MPTIFNCPACKKETYRELPKCPHCGEVFMLGLVKKAPAIRVQPSNTGIKWLDDYFNSFPDGETHMNFGSNAGAIWIAWAFLLFGIWAAVYQLLFEFGFIESGPFG